MIGKKILESEPITSIKVKEILEEYRDNLPADSENAELNYEQNITLSRLEKLPHYHLEDAEKMVEEISELNIKPKVAVRIVDLIPKDLSDLRLIFAKEVHQPTKEEMEKILEILESYDVVE